MDGVDGVGFERLNVAPQFECGRSMDWNFDFAGAGTGAGLTAGFGAVVVIGGDVITGDVTAEVVGGPVLKGIEKDVGWVGFAGI